MHAYHTAGHGDISSERLTPTGAPWVLRHPPDHTTTHQVPTHRNRSHETPSPAASDDSDDALTGSDDDDDGNGNSGGAAAATAAGGRISGGGRAAAAAAAARPFAFSRGAGGPVPYVRSGSMMTNPLGAAMSAPMNFERELSELRQSAAAGELDRFTWRGTAELGAAGEPEERGGGCGGWCARRGRPGSAGEPGERRRGAGAEVAAVPVASGTVAAIASSLEPRQGSRGGGAVKVKSPSKLERAGSGTSGDSVLLLRNSKGGWLNC